MKKLKEIIRGVLACVLLVCPALTGRAQVNADQVLAIGRNVLSLDDYMLAIQYFNLAIKAKPYLAEPYFFRALAKLELEDYSGAEDDCSLAIERNKYRTEAYKLRGFVRQRMGRDSLAIQDYDFGLQYNPLDKYFLFYKAVAQITTKRYAGADSTFTSLLRAYPNFEDGYTARANLRLQTGDTIASLADIDKAISLSKNIVNAYLMRAEIEAQRHQWEDAIADMDAALKLQPQEPDMYVNRAFLRYNHNDYFGAMADYNYALELDPANESALFNRALLRYEVRDLQNSVADLSKVLSLDPANFHALFNRGLVALELGDNQQALSDFTKVTERYPKFYQAYYGKAEAYQNMGNTRKAIENYYHAEDLVKRYVTNPEKNPLDRPAVAMATTNRRGLEEGEGESETEVMERFNQLVTVSATGDTPLAYNDRYKGKVQDRQIPVEPEPMYAVTVIDSPGALRTYSNYFRELDDLNSRHYLSHLLYLSNNGVWPTDPTAIHSLFSLYDGYTAALSEGSPRPVDYLGRSIVAISLKNYETALEDLTSALSTNPDFTVAWLARGVAHWEASRVRDEEQDETVRQMMARDHVAKALADFDQALKLNPRLVYAWFNKGNIYYLSGDFTSARQCYSEALSIDPSFGEALYNRALSYLQTGNKQSALSDLSKAGELGVMPAYRLLKGMK